MTESAFNTVACPACHKRFVWKAELAGQAVRCTCGKAFMIGDAPENLPLEERPRPQVGGASILATDFEALPISDSPVARVHCPSCNLIMRPGATVCINCGYDLRAKERVQTRVGQDEAARMAVPAPPMPSPDFIAPAEDKTPARTPFRGGSRVGAALAEREDDRASRFFDLQLPIIFIITGLGMSVFVPILNGHPVTAGLVYTAAQLLLKVPLMLAALAVAAKLLDIGYGSLSTSTLKLAGIALGPMALANLILGAVIGATMGFGIWLGVFFYIVIAGVPLAYMFDLEPNETLITLVVMIVVEMCFKLFVFAVLLAMFS